MQTLVFLGSIALLMPTATLAQSVPDVRVPPSSLNRSDADRAHEAQSADAERQRSEELARRDAQAAARVSQRPANDASIGAGTSLAPPSIAPPLAPPQN